MQLVENHIGFRDWRTSSITRINKFFAKSCNAVIKTLNYFLLVTLTEVKKKQTRVCEYNGVKYTELYDVNVYVTQLLDELK